MTTSMVRTFTFDMPIPEGRDADEVLATFMRVVGSIAPHHPKLHGVASNVDDGVLRFSLRIAGQKGYLLATNAKHMAAMLLFKAGLDFGKAKHIATVGDRSKRTLTKAEGRNMGEPKPRGFRNPKHDRQEWWGDEVSAQTDSASPSPWTF